jgi:type II secretory pathway pseudopilin PulG
MMESNRIALAPPPAAIALPEPREGEAGFTLMEALVAILVLVFGLIGIANLMLAAASSNSVAHQATAATAQASRTLEDLKAQPYDTLFGSLGGASSIGNLTAPGDPCCRREDQIPGVGTILTRWRISQPSATDQELLFIEVVSEGTGVLSRTRSRAHFTTFRSCTQTEAPASCPCKTAGKVPPDCA